MKIGMVGTVWLNIPPSGYGGTEQIVYNITEGLVKNGHDVTLFGPATSHTSAHLVPTVEKPLREVDVPWENLTYPISHFTQVFDRAKDFDILHVHLNKTSDFVALPFALYTNTPTLFTLHFRVPDPTYKADRHMILHRYRALPYSSISKSQQRPDRLNYIANIYNSILLEAYPYNETPDDYVAWLGKFIPIKGAKEAILAAKKAGQKLILMGAAEEGVPEAMKYFSEEILPHVDGKQVILKKNVDLPEKAEVLGKAKVLLNPILWEEPFGLVMAEAQATGTPVIAFNRGAAPEVVQNNKTGFVVHTLDEMIAKIKDISRIKRQDCRDWVATAFSPERMVQGYEYAYQTVIDNWKEYTKEQWKIIRSD